MPYLVKGADRTGNSWNDAMASHSLLLFTWELWELPGKEFTLRGELGTCFWLTENQNSSAIYKIQTKRT